MNRVHVLLLSRLLWSLLLFHCTSAPAVAQSNPTVVNYVLVSTARITRTVSSFTYRVQLNNPLPHNLAGVQATVTSRSAATQVIDGSVTFGDVSSAATVASLDTFTIQHDRTVPFDTAALIWSVGVRLTGSAATLAHGAIVTLPPVGADPSEIKEGVILSRLDVFLAADATVGDVNAALDQIGARIVSMVAGGDAVTVAVPPRPGIDGLQTLAQTLMTFPGVRLAIPGLQSGVDLLHASNDVSEASHLVPARFPAAWNAASLASNCDAVPLVIQDQFRTKPAGFDALFPSFPNPVVARPTGARVQDEHGYHMFAVAAAPLGLSVSPGANPFVNCLSFKPIQKAGTTLEEELAQLALGLPPAGKFVLSYSLSLPAGCKALDPATQEIKLVDCNPLMASQRAHILPPLARARLALEWKKMTIDKWPDFLAATSASNELNKGLSGVTLYPGVGRAANTSPMSIAAKADPLFAFALDASQWVPAQSFLEAGFPSLLPSQADMDNLRADVRAAGLENSVADNVVVVGGLTALAEPLRNSPGHELLREADFSNSSPDVKAVASDVSGVCVSSPCAKGTGNSRAAPQVAGLATYLWALSPELRAQPASVARRAIVDNAREDGLTPNILDAYATVLSLDPTATPDPETWKVRRHILDVNTGGASAGRFDENDIAEFLSTFFALDPSGNLAEPQVADFSRYDLNGDGFTGGSKVERFDLDRFGSTRFGKTIYQQVTQEVEGNVLAFNENEVTDLDVLCFYAYSPLYAGDLTARRERLQFLPGSRQCVFSVRPSTATVSSGQTVQFEASSPDVIWSATGGTISNTGLFTADDEEGTFTVRATRVGDAGVVAEAEVTIAPRSLFGTVEGLSTFNNVSVHDADRDEHSGSRHVVYRVNELQPDPTAPPGTRFLVTGVVTSEKNLTDRFSFVDGSTGQSVTCDATINETATATDIVLLRHTVEGQPQYVLFARGGTATTTSVFTGPPGRCRQGSTTTTREAEITGFSGVPTFEPSGALISVDFAASASEEVDFGDGGFRRASFVTTGVLQVR